MAPPTKGPRWSDTTAIFGGTFDPPHLGHLEAIQGLFRNPGIGRLLLLPSPVPPHKMSVATQDERIQMAGLLKDALDASRAGPVEIDLSEVERAAARPAGEPTYSFDTVQELKRAIPQLAFVIGVDQLEKFHTWHRYSELLGICHWLVLERKPDGGDRAHAVLRAWEASGILASTSQAGEWRIPGSTDGARCLKLVPTDARNVSSTWIREQIALTGQPPDGTLLESVKAYLKLRRIYGSS